MCEVLQHLCVHARNKGCVVVVLNTNVYITGSVLLVMRVSLVPLYEGSVGLGLLPFCQLLQLVMLTKGLIQLSQLFLTRLQFGLHSGRHLTLAITNLDIRYHQISAIT